MKPYFVFCIALLASLGAEAKKVAELEPNEAGRYAVTNLVETLNETIRQLNTNTTDTATLSASIGATGGNPYDWWFEPVNGTLGRSTNLTLSAQVLTNYADIITYDVEITPLTHTVTYDVIISNEVEDVRYYSSTGLFDVNPTNGLCVSQVAGTEDVLLVSPSLTRRINLVSQPTLPGEEGYSETVASHAYIAGSIKAHVNSNFTAMVSGHDGSESDLAIFSTKNDSTTNYVRNATGWMAGLDITCVPAWRTSSAKFMGVAITHRHILLASHTTFNIGVGTTFRFVDNSNNVYERTATAGYYPGDDAYVVRLDSNLPAAITPARFLPSDWEDYIPYTRGFTNYLNDARWIENYPLVLTDQYRRATIGESLGNWFVTCATYNSDYGTYGQSFLFDPVGPYRCLFQRRDTFVDFYRTKIGGDSGGAMLLYVEPDEPICVGTFTTPGGTWANLRENYTLITNQIANVWGDTNVWETADFSGYTTFTRVD